MSDAQNDGKGAFFIDSSSPKPVELDPTVDFIAGTISGMASLVVGFPFDTVKVRFQSPDIAGKYRSTFHAIATIIQEEKFLGLYKGITSPLASVALMNGLVFSSYRFFMKIQLENGDSIPTLAQIALAGAGCGIVSSIVTTPTELIKIRQQALLTPTSAPQVALQIFREQGMRGLYRGITATALRDIGYGAYFAGVRTCLFIFSFACRILSNTVVCLLPDNHLSWPVMLLAGGVAGIAGWVVTFPFDVVKTRIQGTEYSRPHAPLPAAPMHISSSTPLLGTAASTDTVPVRGGADPISSASQLNPYRTTWSTIVNSYRAEGLGVFFRGLAPTLIRAIPVNMVTFTTFETIVRAFS
ncbi:mitochondrial carrier domain-containing protein [Cyathus striatus]|nr:mitochondrial carrier domain-containing protein [Cyathus striatus]